MFTLPSLIHPTRMKSEPQNHVHSMDYNGIDTGYVCPLSAEKCAFLTTFEHETSNAKTCTLSFCHIQYTATCI